jgi:hypothetical protein
MAATLGQHAVQGIVNQAHTAPTGSTNEVLEANAW